MCLHPSRLEYWISSRYCQKNPAHSLTGASGANCRTKMHRHCTRSPFLRKRTIRLQDRFSGSVPRAILVPSRCSQWRLSKSRSPYSCGTAQASHLFPRHEAFYYYGTKSRRTHHLPHVHKFFIYYKRMKFILQYRYPYRYIHEKCSKYFKVSLVALRKICFPMKL